MDPVYWISLIVGGFFVLLSVFGGADSEADADFDGDLDFDADLDGDLDFDADADAEIGASEGFVDLFSLRALFLFAAFFGLCGVLLPLADVGGLLRLLASLATGATVGLGGNYVIKRVGYAQVSSEVTPGDLLGSSANVLIPFDADEVGKIVLVAKGKRMQLVARAFENVDEQFAAGDDVVVVRVDGAVAEVVKPS